MNDNEETRNWNELAAENKELRDSNEILQLKVAQMRQTIADYERAHAVAEAMAANNDKLGSTDQSQKNNAFLEQQGEYLKDELGQERASKIRNRLLGRTRVYRAQGEVVKVDEQFARHMFGAAIGWLTFETRDYSNNPAYDDGIKKAIEAWEQR